MRIPYIRVQIIRGVMEQPVKDVVPFEIAILEDIFGKENVIKDAPGLGRLPVMRELKSPGDEYERLSRIYGVDPETGKKKTVATYGSEREGRFINMVKHSIAVAMSMPVINVPGISLADDHPAGPEGAETDLEWGFNAEDLGAAGSELDAYGMDQADPAGEDLPDPGSAADYPNGVESIKSQLDQLGVKYRANASEANLTKLLNEALEGNAEEAA